MSKNKHNLRAIRRIYIVLRSADLPFVLLILSILPLCLFAQTADQPRLEVLTGHTNPGTVSFEFSPSGDKLLTNGADDAIIWDRQTGLEIRRFTFAGFDPYRVAFCNDETLLIHDHGMRLEGVTSGTNAEPAFDSPLIQFVCSPDASTVAGVDTEGNFLVQAIPSGKVLARQKIPGWYLLGMRFVSSHKIIGWKRSFAFAYDISQDQLQLWRADADNVFSSLAFQPTGIVAAIYSRSSSSLDIRDLSSGKTIRHFDSCFCAVTAMDKDSHVLVSIESHESISRLHTWDLSTGNPMAQTDVNPLVVNILVDPQAESVAVAGPPISFVELGGRSYASVEFVSLRTGAITSVHTGELLESRNIGFLKDGRMITSGDDTMNIWDAEVGDIADSVPLASLTEAGLSSNGRYLAVKRKGGALTLTDLGTGSASVFPEAASGSDMTVSSNGQYLSWVESTGKGSDLTYSIRLMHFQSRQISKVGCADDDREPHLAFSDDSTKLLSWCDDGYQRTHRMCVDKLAPERSEFCNSLGQGTTVLGFGRRGTTIVVVKRLKGRPVSIKTLDVDSLVEMSSVDLDEAPQAMAYDAVQDTFSLISSKKISVFEKGANLSRVVRSIPGSFVNPKAAACNNAGVILIALESSIIRLVNSRTGILLGDLVLFDSERDWVFVTPAGSFDGTAEAMKWVGWRDGGLAFYPLDYLFNDFYNPQAFTSRLLKSRYLAKAQPSAAKAD